MRLSTLYAGIMLLLPNIALARGNSIFGYSSSGYLCHIQNEKTTKTDSQDVDKITPLKKSNISETDTPPLGHQKNSIDNDVLTIYFETAEDRLYDNDIHDIEKFLASLPVRVNSFVLEGYADYRGTNEYNLDLSKRRAESAQTMLFSSYLGVEPFTQIVTYGESNAAIAGTDSNALAANRRVRIIPNKLNNSMITTGLDSLVADYYLLDQSESINDYFNSSLPSKWEEVVNYNFPEDARLYTFTTARRTCETRLSDQRPAGGTPLYLALFDLVETAERGKKITVLTDGEDTEPKDGYIIQRILYAARVKNLSISFLGLTTSPSKTLYDVSHETNGKYYIFRK